MASRVGVESDNSSDFDARRRSVMSSPILFLFVFALSNAVAVGKKHPIDLSIIIIINII